MAQKLLIVDDHNGFRAEAKELLRGELYEVIGEAEDGQSGVAAACALRPDVVLVDIQLPDFDGFEVTRRILATPSAPTVILISSRERAEFGRRIGASGAAGFIFKGDLGRESIESVLAALR